MRFKLDDKYIPPTKIIPLLEETGLIIAVGEFIIKRACLFLNQVRKYHPNFRVSINVSYIQILKGVDFISFFDILRDYNLPNDAFIVELTESGYLESNELVNNAWKGLKIMALVLLLMILEQAILIYTILACLTLILLK